jgi:hypothetical protein
VSLREIAIKLSLIILLPVFEFVQNMTANWDWIADGPG